MKSQLRGDILASLYGRYPQPVPNFSQELENTYGLKALADGVLYLVAAGLVKSGDPAGWTITSKGCSVVEGYLDAPGVDIQLCYAPDVAELRGLALHTMIEGSFGAAYTVPALRKILGSLVPWKPTDWVRNLHWFTDEGLLEAGSNGWTVTVQGIDVVEGSIPCPAGIQLPVV